MMLDIPRITAVSIALVFLFQRYQYASATHAARRGAEELAKYRDRVIFSNFQG